MGRSVLVLACAVMLLSQASGRLSPLERLYSRLQPSTTAAPDYPDDYSDEDYANSEEDDYRLQNDHQQLSPASAAKWESLGTREAVENSRRQHMLQQQEGVPEALAHARRVNREGACGAPARRLVRVSALHPHPSKTFIPHCVLLHRCSDDAGCCHSDTLSCVARRQHRVHFFFYVTDVSGERGVEKLSFYNHTECGCEDVMVRDASPRASLWPSQAPRCRCPSAFSPRPLRDACACDCFDGEHECLRLKHGRAPLPPADSACVRTGRCTAPRCEFGAYLLHAARCPRRRDALSAWASVASRPHD